MTPGESPGNSKPVNGLSYEFTLIFNFSKATREDVNHLNLAVLLTNT